MVRMAKPQSARRIFTPNESSLSKRLPLEITVSLSLSGYHTLRVPTYKILEIHTLAPSHHTPCTHETSFLHAHRPR